MTESRAGRAMTSIEGRATTPGPGSPPPPCQKQCTVCTGVYTCTVCTGYSEQLTQQITTVESQGLASPQLLNPQYIHTPLNFHIKIENFTDSEELLSEKSDLMEQRNERKSVDT